MVSANTPVLAYMILHPTQATVAKDTHRFRILCCGRRWGKTTLAIDQIKGRAAIPNSNVVYVAPTYQQARDIAWNSLKKDLINAGKINESRLEIDLVNGSRIVLRGWESIETLRGQQFDLVVLDEVAMMRNFWENWHEVIRPTLTDTKGEGLFISTPKGFNHFYDLFNLEAKDDDFKSFQFTTLDNPHIHPDEVEKARKELPEDRFAQEYMADFRKSEGLVYKEFNRAMHIFKELPINMEFVTTFGGHDFGTNNPCASITIKKDRDARYWVTEEFYKSGLTDAQQAEYVAALRWDACYPDPASASGMLELKKRGVNVREVVKTKDSIRNGINTVKELFITGRLRIHESCKNLIFELETYSYPEKRPDNNESENPIKENDHACFTKDAVLEFPLSERLQFEKTGTKDVYEFMGSKVTADHPYLTQRGFVRLDALRYSDKIVLWKNGFLTALSLDDTQTQSAVSFGTISYLLQRVRQASKLNASTGMYGKNIMGRYLGGFMFTIKMATHLIIMWTISNSYHLKNTIVDTIKKCYQSGVKTWRKTLDPRLLSGINLKQGKLSIGGLLNSLGKTKSILKRIVGFVIKNMKPRFPNEVNIATIIAKLKHCGQEDVYASSTNSGFFVANGIIVSNCDALRYALTMDNVATVKKYRPVIQSPPRQKRNIAL